MGKIAHIYINKSLTFPKSRFTQLCAQQVKSMKQKFAEDIINQWLGIFTGCAITIEN